MIGNKLFKPPIEPKSFIILLYICTPFNDGLLVLNSACKPFNESSIVNLGVLFRLYLLQEDGITILVGIYIDINLSIKSFTSSLFNIKFLYLLNKLSIVISSISSFNSAFIKGINSSSLVNPL